MFLFLAQYVRKKGQSSLREALAASRTKMFMDPSNDIFFYEEKCQKKYYYHNH
jgi:hypothetical protein